MILLTGSLCYGGASKILHATVQCDLKESFDSIFIKYKTSLQATAVGSLLHVMDTVSIFSSPL